VLIRFEVANFRSILEPVELSMVAVDRDRPQARDAPNLGESLLSVSGIYGPNASGKSNVVAALAWLIDAVRDSLRTWEDEIPVEPFAFAGGENRPSEFTLEYLIDGVRFEYVIELDRHAVRYEGLFHYPERKRRRIFERDGENLTLQRGLGRLSGTRELLTSRTLALSAARRFDEPVVSGFAQHLISGGSLNTDSMLRRLMRYTKTAWAQGRFEDDEQAFLDLFAVEGTSDRAERDQALALLQLADLGVDDVLVDNHKVRFPGADDTRLRMIQRRIRLVHRTAAGGVPLDFAVESEGTRTWFHLIGPVLNALRSGALLLFDELDASLHPRLSSELLRLFHDPVTNPKGAQLIFTSHDTSLLNHLNRDEVWLTEKNEDGVTRLGALAEFAGERVRRSQNLEKAYLHGRFGALPDVDRTEMLRALGLIG
jgi:predicted ATPase